MAESKVISGEEDALAHSEAEAVRLKGVEYRKAKDFDKALAAYDEAIRLDPAYGRSYLSKGDCLQISMKNYAEAAEAYKKALKAYDAYQGTTEFAAALRFNIGLGYANMGDVDSAVHYFRETLKADPNYVKAKSQLEKLGAAGNEAGSESLKAEQEKHLMAVSKNWHELENVPLVFRMDDEIIREALNQNGSALHFVPENKKTPEMCLAAVKHYVAAFEYVPENMKNKEICLEAVRQAGDALRDVPESLRDKEMCLTAVKQFPFSVAWVPEKILDDEICAEAAAHGALANINNEYLANLPVEKIIRLCLDISNHDDSLMYVPEKLRTADVCLRAVKKSGQNFSSVPEALRTPELCSLAIASWSMSLRDVPENLRTLELCYIAASDNTNALEFVPKDLKEQVKTALYFGDLKYADRKITSGKAALKSAWESHDLKDVPEDLLTPEMCLRVMKEVNRGMDQLKYVPIKWRTREMCITAMANSAGGDKYGELVPPEVATQDFWHEAIKINGWTIASVPEALQTEKLCIEAVGNKTGAKGVNILRAVPENKRTYDVCLAAVKSSGANLVYVPEKFLDYKMCLSAVKTFGQALRYVPDEFMADRKKEFTLCIEAVKAGHGGTEETPRSLLMDEKMGPELSLAAVLTPEGQLEIQYIPYKWRTLDLCLTYLRSGNFAVPTLVRMLDFVPADIRPDVCNRYKSGNLLAKYPAYKLLTSKNEAIKKIQHSSDNLYHLSANLYTEEFFLEYIEKCDNYHLGFIPVDFRTEAVCNAAVKKNSAFLQWVPKEFKTAELCSMAVAAAGLPIQYVPMKMRTKDLCLSAVRSYDWISGSVFEYIPEQWKTKELYVAAVKAHRNALQYVPEALKEQVQIAIANGKEFADEPAAKKPTEKPVSEKTKSVPVKVDSSEEPRTCASCGKPLKPGAKFCSECGAKIETKPKGQFCTNCGATLKPNAKFCTECGTKAN